MTLNLKPGDPWPFASRRGLTGAPCSPVWHALVVRPQSERKAADRLSHAASDVVYPTTETVRHRNGKKIVTERPMVPCIIYARFAYTPNWDVMKERRVIVGVFSRDGTPIALDGDDVARVMGLPTEAERIEAERLDALRPRIGEKAEIMSGPFSGFFVDVTRVEYGRVWWEMVSGLKGDVDQAIVRRVAE